MSGVKVTNERSAGPIPAVESVDGEVDGDNVDWEPGDSGAGELDQWKQPVRAATTANITIATALNAGDSVDGVTLVSGDRVLVKDQTAPAENGIYLAGATPERAVDMDEDDEVVGAVVVAVAGTTNEGTTWRAENTTAPVIGTDGITFASFSDTPGLVTVTDGTVTVTPATTMTVPVGGVADLGGDNADLRFLTNRYGAQPAVVTNAAVTTAYAIDCSQGSWFDLTLTGNTTFTITNPPPAAGEIFVILRQGGAGSKLATWPGSVDWQEADGTGGGSAPTLHTAVGALNVIGLATVDGGTTWGGADEGGTTISYATPAIVLGSSAAAGAASTVIRSDSTIAAFDATVPVTQAFGDTAATGSAAFAARRDHKHGMPSSSVTAADVAALGFVGPILITDSPSTPLVFADLLQNDAQDDLMYADL